MIFLRKCSSIRTISEAFKIHDCVLQSTAYLKLVQMSFYCFISSVKLMCLPHPPVMWFPDSMPFGFSKATAGERRGGGQESSWEEEGQLCGVWKQQTPWAASSSLLQVLFDDMGWSPPRRGEENVGFPSAPCTGRPFSPEQRVTENRVPGDR